MKLPRGLWRHVLTHPADGFVLARMGWRFRRSGWWHRAPFLPVPGEQYWEFRRQTALGYGDEQLSLEALLDAAKWSMRQPSRH
jgi:hypothetical protein